MQTYWPKFFPYWILFLCACQLPNKNVLQPVTFSSNEMTIDYHISIGHFLSNDQKKQIQHIIDNTFAEINAIYNKWNPLSEVTKLNQSKAYEKILLSPQLDAFFSRIDAIVKISQGRFDPTIEPLQQLWKRCFAQDRIPLQEEIEALKPCLGWDKIHLESGLFYKEDSRTQLDLGGIAKGFCVDLLVERLNLAGFQNVLVEWGGEIRASGQHPSQRPWTIYISRLEDHNSAHAIAYIGLDNRAIATSGDYFQFWKVGEDTYCHIFNPLTLAPLLIRSNSIASASILAQDCVTADGMAKTLMMFDSMSDAQTWIESIRAQNHNLNYWMVARP